LIVLGLILWNVARPQLQALGVVAAPKWIINNEGGDDSCSVLGDYCVRVKCSVSNGGDAPGIVTVAAALTQANNSSVVARRIYSVALVPGENKALTFDFPEAEINGQYRGGCRIQKEPSIN
jgi:hypothetical protein